MTYEQRQEVISRLLLQAEDRAGDTKYAWAFGLLSAIVSDEALQELSRQLEREGY